MNLPSISPVTTSRRNFMRRGIALPLVAAFGFPYTESIAAFGPIKRIGGPHLLIGVNAYSFSDLLKANAKDAGTGVDLFGVCEFCAKQNVDAVDLTGYFFPGYPKAPSDEYIFRIKRHAHDLGLAISGTGVRNDFVAADKSVRDEGVQRAKEWIEVAAKLGAPTIRLFADSQAPFKNWQMASDNASRDVVEGWMADSFRECAEHAKKFGVIIAVQNHADFICTGQQHLSLLQRVDHESCMALVDTGKYVTKDPYVDIALMVPYAVNWQIKETLDGNADSPRTDFKKLVTIICNGGYRGFLPIETLSMGRKNYDPFSEVAMVLTELRASIATN